MNLYIRVKNDEAFEHPIFEENFKQAFPEIDINNLPEGFAKFERIPAPPLGPYEKDQYVKYEKGTDGIYRDVWYTSQMSNQEILKKQEQVKQQWIEYGYSSWIFDENTCSFIPPTPYPNDGKNYYWDEPSLSWIKVSLPSIN